MAMAFLKCLCVSLVAVQGSRENRHRSLSVLGAGLPGTGTQSLARALKLLGFRTLHGSAFDGAPRSDPGRAAWLECRRPSDNCSLAGADRGFDAVVGDPFYHGYAQVATEMPDAKVVLTVRDNANDWYDSLIAMWGAFRLYKEVWSFAWVPFEESIAAEDYKKTSLHSDSLIGCNFFAPPSTNQVMSCISGYHKHFDDVLASVPSDRLLVFNVKEGWAPLCEFLALPVPNEHFPNEDVYSGASWKARGWRWRLVAILSAAALAGSPLLLLFLPERFGELQEIEEAMSAEKDKHD